MPRHAEPEILTTEEAFSQLTVNELKSITSLISSPPPPRKGELVGLLTRAMRDPERVRALYEGLDETAQLAVQEAVQAAGGALDLGRFKAKYGRSPDYGSGEYWSRRSHPTALRLFFPQFHVLPSDLRTLLGTFVPEPPPLTVQASDDLPARVRRPYVELGEYYSKPDEEEVELRVRETARAAQQELKAVLRLIDVGEVRVSEKTRRPTQASMKTIAGVLTDGDFYAEAERSDWEGDPDADLTIKPFAWPLIVQAAGLAQLAGTKLQLTPAGRKAAVRPAHEAIRLAWNKWLKTSLLDEFNRVSAIKGQQSKGALSALAPRRQAVAALLQQCPVKRWISTAELFRVLKASSGDFSVSRDTWKLNINGMQYGSLGYDARYTWETIEGRYVLAFCFEYAATLGLLDVAYISPRLARNDYRDRWGTDDLSCLSRYDGLLTVRINALGAWCLGLANEYEPEVVLERPVLEISPNLDVKASGAEPPAPADVLFLDRYAERRAKGVWQLSAPRILAAVEQGSGVAELAEFLAAKSAGPVPDEVEEFLADLQNRVGQLEDLGAARLIACADPGVARQLADDRRLRQLCRLAGERFLVFRAVDEAAFRRVLREMGYILPPSK